MAAETGKNGKASLLLFTPSSRGSGPMPSVSPRRTSLDSAIAVTGSDEIASELLDKQSLEQTPDAKRKPVICKLDHGVSSARGQVWSYYLSRPDGTPVLVLEQTQGGLIRLDDKIDIIVVEVYGGHVKLGLRRVADTPTSHE